MLSGMVAKLVDKFAKDRLVRGFGALGLGELFVRLSRVVTTIILARTLSAAELGIAATALACFELVRVLANNGVGQMVVRATDERLAATCNTAYRLAWIVCLLMAAIQTAAGFAIAHFAGRPELAWMILALAGVYVFIPWGMVQSWLLLRDFSMRAIATVNTVQVGTDNLLTAGLAIGGLGPWAVVLPKLLTAPIWLIGTRRAKAWKRDASAGTIPMKEVLVFAAPILASEILGAVRFNVDKLLVGAILGIEALGIYYFAFSAGYGFTIVLTSALAAASFPHLADYRLSTEELLARFDKAMIKLALPISALIGLQCIAVFYYVPLLFGERWTPYVPIVAVLCASAMSKSCYDLGVQLLRASGKSGTELLYSAAFTIALLGSFAAGLTSGLMTGVAVLCVATLSVQIALTYLARRLVAVEGRAKAAAIVSSPVAVAGGRM